MSRIWKGRGTGQVRELRGVGAALQVGEQPPGRGQAHGAVSPPTQWPGLVPCGRGPVFPAQGAFACSLPLS